MGMICSGSPARARDGDETRLDHGHVAVLSDLHARRFKDRDGLALVRLALRKNGQRLGVFRIVLDDGSPNGLNVAEVGVAQRARCEGHSRHDQDEHAADGHGPVQFPLGLDRHEADRHLRLRQHADAHAQGDGGDENPPEIVLHASPPEGRHGGPARMADGLQFARDKRRHFGQLRVGRGDAAQLRVGVADEQQHAQQHHRALKRVAVHHALQPASHHVGRHDERQNQHGGHGLRDSKRRHERLGAAHEHGHGVQRHEDEDDQPCEDLNEPAAVALAEEFGERVRPHAMSHAPGGAAEKHKGDENAHEDVKERQPQQTHAKQARHAAETHNGGRADERGSIGHGHGQKGESACRPPGSPRRCGCA